MASINLLTTKIAPKSSVVKTSNTLKMVGLVWTIVFFVGVFVMVAIFLVNSQQIRSSLSRQEQLKSVIRSLEKTEQTYVLVKDRAVKINEIYQDGSATDELLGFYGFAGSLPEGSSIDDIEVVPGKVESTMSFNSSKILTESLAVILAGERYDRVEMETFTFSPQSGYRLILTFLTQS